MADPDAIDQAALDRLEEWGGTRLLGEMIRLFLENATKRVDEIREGLAENEASGVERGAHSLKSSAANVGAAEVRRLAEELEDIGHSGDLDGARARVEDLVRALEGASERLREVREGLTQ